MKITVLGSGTSQGVPVIACECHVCTSSEPKDKRLRSSIMISDNEQNYVVDAGPDFRQQMLREDVKTLSAILFTHEHKDHLAGLDDVRAFNYKEKRDMEVYCSFRVEKALHQEFHYVFSAERYPGVPSVNINRIENKVFTLADGLEVTPIEVYHYKMPVFGFRIGDFTYITDANHIDVAEMEKIRGSKVLIINALRQEKHISHFTLQEAVDLAAQLNIPQTYFTHISHHIFLTLIWKKHWLS